MAEGLAQTPEMKNYIAPDLDKKSVYYILRNFHADINITSKINSRAFAKAYKIKKSQRKSIKPRIKALKPPPITIDESDMNLDDWNKVRKSEKVLHLFPFMESFASDEPKKKAKTKVKKIVRKQKPKRRPKQKAKKAEIVENGDVEAEVGEEEGKEKKENEKEEIEENEKKEEIAL